jgi:hypothetical protein
MYAGAKDVRSSPFSRVGAIVTASCEMIVDAFVVSGTTMTFGCSAAKRCVSSTITHGLILFVSLARPSPPLLILARGRSKKAIVIFICARNRHPVVIAERLETKMHLVENLVPVVSKISSRRFRWRLIH